MSGTLIKFGTGVLTKQPRGGREKGVASALSARGGRAASATEKPERTDRKGKGFFLGVTLAVTLGQS